MIAWLAEWSVGHRFLGPFCRNNKFFNSEPRAVTELLAIEKNFSVWKKTQEVSGVWRKIDSNLKRRAQPPHRGYRR